MNKLIARDPFFEIIIQVIKVLHVRLPSRRKAVVLKGFRRSFQINDYSCGPRCVYSILRYYGRDVSVRSVQKQLRTTEDGTELSKIKRVLKKYGLRYVSMPHCRISDLQSAIRKGHPILVTLFDDQHYSVVFGYSEKAVFLSNPSLNFMSYGSLFCTIGKKEFKGNWDSWGLIVSERNT